MKKFLNVAGNILAVSGLVLMVWLFFSWLNVLFGGGNITWWNFFLLFTEMFG